GRAPRRGGDFPVTVRAKLGDEIGAIPTLFRERGIDAVGTAVDVDAEQIEAGVVLEHGAYLAVAGAGEHGADRMVRVLFLDDPGQYLQFAPDARITAIAFHLVPESPDEKSRVILEAANGGADAVALGLERGCVAVVEAVARVIDPETNECAQTEFGATIEEIPAAAVGFELLHSPGTDGVAAGLTQEFELVVAARSADRIGLAVAQQLPAA